MRFGHCYGKDKIMSTKFDYYYTHEAEQFTFYRIPKALFTEPLFRDLSVEAKVLYGLMLDRVGLSIRSGWVDELDRVYIYFTVADIQQQLGCGHNKAVRLLKELDTDMGLIRRKRQGLGKPDRIYVMNFVTGHVQNSENGNPDASEKPQDEEEVPESVPQRAELETTAIPQTGLLEVSKEAAIKNENNQTEYSSDPSIQIESREDGRVDPNYGDCYALLQNKWGYAALEDNYQPSQLQGIFSLGADVLSARTPTVRVGRQDLPWQQVADRLLSLDFTHIDYVLECISRKAPQPIRNMRAYLLTALYNAPTTIDAYVDAQFARQEGGGAPAIYS